MTARAIAALVVVAIVGVRPLHAGDLSADATCQKALAAGVRRVTGAALKGMEKCHRARMRADLSPAVDCNDAAQFTGTSLSRLQRATSALQARAARYCAAAATPATLGYAPCPDPCGAVTVATYTDVAACLACVVRDRARTLATTLLGSPPPPGTRTDETACHAALARAARQYADTRIQTQRACKAAQDAGGIPGFDCRDGDYQSEISRAVARMHSHLSTQTSCPTASIVALDVCPSAPGGTFVVDPTPTVDILHACVERVANEETNDLYGRVYAPGTPAPPAGPVTTSIASAWVGSGGQNLDEGNPRFRLVVESAATVTLDLSSSAADAYLYLLNADGSVVLAEDDNGGGGSNSRVSVALRAGRYLLVAATVAAGGTGPFTIATDAGSLAGCFFAYPDADYAGGAALFCDAGTGEPLSENTYSSLRIPKGLFVRSYENADRSGRAHTYYGNVATLQPFLDDTVSLIEWGAFDTADFFVFAVSDSQITWSHCSDNSGSGFCSQEQSFFGSASEQEVAFYYNSNLTNALNTLRDHIGDRALAGLIVNGDLTEFGRQDHDLEDYIDLYDFGVRANVYPGLGNHDYANNVDDCFANVCATGMVNYFTKQVASLNPRGFDYTLVETPQSGSPPVRFDYIGSLAYSWDVGDVHFVQLNNYPTYTRLWETALPLSEHWYDIRSSITWLRDDLEDAVAEGKAIIFNLHDWGSADVSAFRDVLDDFPVSAVYAGHYHGTYGRYTESGPYTDGTVVPVFLSGSAHYGTILVSRFTNGRLYVWVLRVDQFNGATLQVQRSGVFEDVSDLSTLFDICPGCTTSYEYVYDFR
jgi:cytolysin (calcineurin-like family phosphatase)